MSKVTVYWEFVVKDGEADVILYPTKEREDLREFSVHEDTLDLLELCQYSEDHTSDNLDLFEKANDDHDVWCDDVIDKMRRAGKLETYLCEVVNGDGITNWFEGLYHMAVEEAEKNG